MGKTILPAFLSEIKLKESTTFQLKALGIRNVKTLVNTLRVVVARCKVSTANWKWVQSHLGWLLPALICIWCLATSLLSFSELSSKTIQMWSKHRTQENTSSVRYGDDNATKILLWCTYDAGQTPSSMLGKSSVADRQMYSKEAGFVCCSSRSKIHLYSCLTKFSV